MKRGLVLSCLLLLSGCGGTLRRGVNLAGLEGLVAKHPEDPELRYRLCRAYCEADSADQAIREYKELVELGSPRAEEEYLRLKIAQFLGLEPYPVRRLTHDSFINASPAFSPDGQRITFFSYRREQGTIGEVYLINRDGTGISQLTEDGEYGGYEPCFTPDNEYIIFSRGGEGLGYDLYRLNLEEKTLERLTDLPGDEGSLSISPDGRLLAFGYIDPKRDDYEILLKDLTTGELRRLTDNFFLDYEPNFSPSGRWICYHTNQDLNYEIYITDTSGRVKRRLTFHPKGDFFPCFGRSDQEIFFTSNRGGNYELYRLDLGSGSLFQITQDPGWDTQPAVSPDGRELAFISYREGTPSIYIAQLTRLITPEELREAIERREE